MVSLWKIKDLEETVWERGQGAEPKGVLEVAQRQKDSID